VERIRVAPGRKSRRHRLTVRKPSQAAHALDRPSGDDMDSHQARGGTMMFDEQQHGIDAETVILGLGYFAGLLILIAWVALNLF
ncbi:MAG: hypothetical protein WBN07_10260, partial [Woeseiaceae bacterium]